MHIRMVTIKSGGDSVPNSTIGKRLQELRDLRGVNQEVAAEACGISRIALARYETGVRVPRMDTAAQLAEYYGVTVDYILGNDMPAAAVPPITEGDPDTAKFATGLEKLSDENLVKLRDYMELLLLQQEAEERKKG